MHEFQCEGCHLKPFGLSIKKVAEITGESPWQVKEKLRRGIYRAKKSGRRTVVTFESVEAAWNALPDAKFKPSKRHKHTEHEELAST
jgi:hypothetical protein